MTEFRWTAVLVIVGILLMLMFGSCSIIGAGQRGVVYSKVSGVRPYIFTEGLNFKVPFIETVTKFSIRTQKLKGLSEGASRDLQLLKIETTLNYRLDATKVAKLYQTVGRDYENVVIVPAIAESVKAASAQFPVEQVIVERPKLKQLITESLAERLARYDIILENLNITDIDFSDEFNKVVEEKQIEEQKIKTAEYKKRQAEQEKQTTILEAEAQAEKQRLLKSQVTKDIVALEWIKKWDGGLPNVMLGESTPLVNIGGGQQ